MRSQLIAWGLALATTLAGASAMGASISAFGPGEQSTYRVQYLGLEAGTAQITVGTETTHWGSQVLPIVTFARSSSALDFYPIRDKFVTYWDPASDRCVGSDLFAEENRSRRRLRIKLDHQAGKATVMRQKDGGAEKTSTHEVAAGSLDIAAATFALRNRPLAVGRTFEMPIFTGTRTFTLRATVEKKETVPTALGPKETFKVRVQTGFGGKLESKRDLVAWFTADDARLPVKVEAEFLLGTLRAELSEYKSGRRYALGALSPTGAGGSGGI
jgi:hypothetical protein